MAQLLNIRRGTGFLLLLLLTCLGPIAEASDDDDSPLDDVEEEESRPTLTDSKLISSMRVNAALGAACLFIFGLLNSHFKMYRLRMSLRRVTIKPPALPKKGWPILWTWLWKTISTSDDQFLATSGLDALMFIKTFSLGIQLFLPLAIIGATILIPIHKHHSSDTDEDGTKNSISWFSNSADDETEDHDSFLSMTTSNVSAGASVFWFHFLCVYLYVFYALFLLYLHQKRFIALRHRYLTARESQHMWTMEKSEEHQETDQAEGGFGRYPEMVRSWMSNQLSKLLEDTNAETSTAGAMSMLASESKPNRSKVIQAFHRTGSLRPSSLANNGTQEVDRTSFGDVGRRSMRRMITRSERFTDQGPSTGFRFDTPPSARFSAEIGYDAWPGARQASGSGPLGERPFKSGTIHEQPPPIEAMNEKSDTSILKWWLLTDNVHEVHSAAASQVKTEGVELSRQSVRFLKTVVTTDTEFPRAKMAVCAQLYCALLTNFPNALDHDKHEKALIDRWMTKAYKLTIAKLARMAKRYLDGPVDLERLGSNISEGMNEQLLPPSNGDNITLKEEAMIELEKQVISDTFSTFFETEFVEAVPILNHKKVDLLLAQWDRTMGILERCEYHNSKNETRKTYQPCKWWSFLCGFQFGVGEAVDAVEYYTKRIQWLEEKIRESQAEVLEQTHANSWLIIFKTQKAASIASQVLLHTENAKNFRVGPAPGPDEMNWQSLWKSKRDKELRQVLVIPFIALLISFPLGIFAGAVSQLNEFFCEDSDSGTYWERYCKDSSSYHTLITAWLPSLVVAVWQNIIMPNALYYLVQASCGCDSFSQLERRIGHLFFIWDTANIFLGAMLGGSVFYKVNAAVKRPQDLIELLGVSVPASSNFFVNYVMLRAFFLLPYRLLVPHVGIWYYVCILGGKLGLANTPRDRALLWASRSVRYGREYGSLLLIFLISIAYSVVSPIILPITLAFFLLAWLIWRYQMLYVFVRKYESGGRMWPLMVNRMIFILWIFQIFTSCVFITKEAYWQAAILWISIPLILRRFHKYCASQFKPRMLNVPLEMTQHSPPAVVKPEVYSPPALCQHCEGWHPEYMKAWEGWRTAAYTI